MRHGLGVAEPVLGPRRENSARGGGFLFREGTGEATERASDADICLILSVQDGVGDL